MEAIISAGLALLSQVAPLLGTSTAVGSAIKFLGAVLPPGVELVKNEIPVVKGIIATLRGKKATTSAQMDDLDALDARCDAILDAAIKAAEASDAEADKG